MIVVSKTKKMVPNSGSCLENEKLVICCFRPYQKLLKTFKYEEEKCVYGEET